VGALGAPRGFDTGAPEAGVDGFGTGALGAPVAGAPDAGMDGAWAHAAEADSWAPKMSNVAIAVRRVIRLAMRVITILHFSALDGPRLHRRPVLSGTG